MTDNTCVTVKSKILTTWKILLIKMKLIKQVVDNGNISVRNTDKPVWTETHFCLLAASDNHKSKTHVLKTHKLIITKFTENFTFPYLLLVLQFK